VCFPSAEGKANPGNPYTPFCEKVCQFLRVDLPDFPAGSQIFPQLTLCLSAFGQQVESQVGLYALRIGIDLVKLFHLGRFVRAKQDDHRDFVLRPVTVPVLLNDCSQGFQTVLPVHDKEGFVSPPDKVST